MGNKNPTREVYLKSNELNEFHNMTSLSTGILIKLHEHYRRFSALKTDDGVIDYSEFCTLINKNEKNLTKRIFNAIDENKDGFINFREFIKFLSCFDTGTIDEQINSSFNILQDPISKDIDCESIIALLREAIYIENTYKKYFPEEIIDKIVRETFKNITGDYTSKIDLAVYRKMVKENPGILTWFKIDFENLKAAKLPQKIKKAACFG